jgi:N-acetylglucosaminyldiphosphoundecaprenol N-acetyl-beta-D-mannosaminyltransferase
MTGRVPLFGMTLDPVSEAEAVSRILAWVDERPSKVRCVITPNVQHALLFQHHEALRAAYADAALVLIDGAPLVWSLRFLGVPVPSRVAGSDLVPALFRAGGQRSRPLSVYLLGAAPGVGDRAASAIERDYPWIRVAGTYSPPLGFENDAAANDEILRRLEHAAPDVLVVGLGAPKQELWTHRHRDRLKVPVALCVGATIDFLAGHRARAPKWMQKLSIEWLHRVITEPNRLGPRYAADAIAFPKLFWREWRTRSRRP